MPGYRSGKPYIVEFAPNQSLLATGYIYQDFISLFDQPNNTLRQLAVAGTAHSRSERFKSLSFSPQAQFLAAGDEAGSIVFWRLAPELDDGMERIYPSTSISPHQSTVSALQFIDEANFVSSGEDERVCISSPFATGAVHQRLSGIAVHNAVLAGNRLLLGCDDGTIRRLTGESIEKTVRSRRPGLAEVTVTSITAPDVCVAGSVSVASLDVSPDGKTIAVGDGQGGINLYDRSSGELLQTFRDRSSDGDEAVLDISFSANGTLLAFAAGDYVTIIEKDSGRQRLHHFDGNGDVVQFFDNDRFLAICQGDTALAIIDVQSGKVVRTISDTDADALDVSPNGKQLTGTQGDGRIWIMDIESGDTRLVTGNHTRSNCVMFAANSRTVVTLDFTGHLRLVDAESGAAFGDVVLPDKLADNYEHCVIVATESWLAAMMSQPQRSLETPATTDFYFWNLSDLQP